MTNDAKRTGAHSFVAFDVALEAIRSLRDVVAVIRRRDSKLAQQIVASAFSVAANIAEGNRRTGRDRLYLFRVAAGSAAETQAHLQVALAWGWIEPAQADDALKHLDRELRLIWGLTR
jgi:four helix bundle protein